MGIFTRRQIVLIITRHIRDIRVEENNITIVIYYNEFGLPDNCDVRIL